MCVVYRVNFLLEKFNLIPNERRLVWVIESESVFKFDYDPYKSLLR
jgi:hypothetical protein